MSDKKIGAFICHCGGNISDYVEVEKVRDAVAGEDNVVLAKTDMFVCSDAAQQDIINEIKDKKLDGIIVASCSPKLHQSTFRAMAKRAGLNQYQYNQVNIREQCSWTHTHNKEEATLKATELVKAGIAKTRFSNSLEDLRITTLPEVIVIGAGVSGLRAALALSDLGLNVYMIEKSENPGGNISKWGKMYPNNKDGGEIIQKLVQQVHQRENITLYTGAELTEKTGSVGKFSVKVRIGSNETVTLHVGAIVVTTGFDTYTPQEEEYGFGLNGVITLPDFKELLVNSKAKDKLEFGGRQVKNIAYIYCVGSRQETGNTYCSRYCCTAGVHTALETAKGFEGINQFHLFRDMRTYGKYELIYDEALQNGSLFLRFSEQEPPVIEQTSSGLSVKVKDKLTANEEIQMNVDLVVLVTGMVPKENKNLINILKLPVGRDGFFNEIHPKLRPVETVVNGVFIAGTSQGPKTLAESVASSMSAVSKSAALLLKGYVDLEPLVATVNPDTCTWCNKCTDICPYDAVEKIDYEGKEVARIVPSLCKGEGACVPICPEQAIDVEGYTNNQIISMIDAFVKEVA
ncbi:FAD-dependent oxidoreductase [bacterium]|nr:FAD-dependent oxidoreductase [bacterium]